MVLLSEDINERGVRHLLKDEHTYKILDFNPFSPLVALINDKLFFALEVDLITKKEFGYLIVDFNTQTFYIIPEILKDDSLFDLGPPGENQ